MSRKAKVIASVAAITAIAAAGAYAFAQGGPGHGRMGMGHGMDPGMGMGMMGGMGHGRGPMMGQAGDPSARLDAIKAEIGIRPEQQTAWDAYAKVVRDVAAERRAHRETVDRDAVHRMEPKDREAFHDGMRKSRDEAFSRVKAAADTLLAQLDDAQKSKARTTLPGLAEQGSGRGMQHGMAGHGGHGMRGGMGQGMGPGMGMGMGHGHRR